MIIIHELRLICLMIASFQGFQGFYLKSFVVWCRTLKNGFWTAEQFDFGHLAAAKGEILSMHSMKRAPSRRIRPRQHVPLDPGFLPANDDYAACVNSNRTQRTWMFQIKKNTWINKICFSMEASCSPPISSRPSARICCSNLCKNDKSVAASKASGDIMIWGSNPKGLWV